MKFDKHKEIRSFEPEEVIDTGVSGLMPEESLGGSKFFITFTNKASNYIYVYFMIHTSDVFDRLKEYERAITNKFGVTMKVLRSENDREYYNLNLQDYLKEKPHNQRVRKNHVPCLRPTTCTLGGSSESCSLPFQHSFSY